MSSSVAGPDGPAQPGAAQPGGTSGAPGVPRELLTSAEQRFERGRRTVGLFLAPLVLLALLLAPLDLEADEHRLAAVLVCVMILWITEAVPLPVGGLIGVVLATLLNVAPADDILAPFGSSTIFTFIGAFVLAQAMLRHGLARRFAFRVLATRGVAVSTTRTVVAFGLITCALSAFVSNTATVAMLLPTAVAILGTVASASRVDGSAGETRSADSAAREEALARRGNPRVSVALLLMLAYGASVGGLLTPVGSPPNLIGRGLIEDATGTRISFFRWMALAVPVCAVMFVVLAVVLLLLNRPEVKRLEGLAAYVAAERRKLGPLSPHERNTLIAFGTAVTLWILPGVVGLVAGDGSDVYASVSNILDEGVVAVFAASLLFLLPVNWRTRTFTMTWDDAARIDWGTILLFGTGIILGGLLRSTGLAETIGTASAQTFGISALVPLTIFAVLLAILISETTSNTAAATVVVPIVISLAGGAGVDPLVPAMAATFAASFGFMLPVSTPQNAIVYGSGMVPITKMIRSGAAFDVAGAVLIVLLLPLMSLALGLAG
ncbi:SLC13 family permease [Thermasporomyces composti]|jgi:sodium-dependent dicarboxylate transporter 2/3/5|uniref:Sodium-dependent dicarboxylate transporter SdcS n=1 Tax=Thermasporomyces composti TaxID=696763 RepID=A0A3D9V561_THECX|nr:SLC13 family permease [Thermasporomyces composti]REF35310.1 sodium-dependent dicarboxylate transporter 2/3/5 [Thermasporomyces composti]